MGTKKISGQTYKSSISNTDIVMIEDESGDTFKIEAYKLGFGITSRIEGFIVSNNQVDIVHDLNISAGFCYDSTGTAIINQSESLVKRLDATFSAGTNNGMLQSGQTHSANKSYKLYVISDDAGTTIDYIATEYNIPLSLPTGYTIFRYIFSFRTVVSTGEIQLFRHIGNETFIFNDFIDYEDNRSSGTTTITSTKIPLGLTQPMVLYFLAHDLTGAGTTQIQNKLPSTNSQGLVIAGTDKNQLQGYIFLDENYQCDLINSSTDGIVSVYARSFVDFDREALL